MNKHLVLFFVLFLIPPLIIPSLTYAQNNQTSSSKLEEMLKNAKPKELNPAPVNFTSTLSGLSPFPLVGGPLVEVEYQTDSIVVLKADEDFVLKTSLSMVPFWKAIDIVKSYGYNLRDITTSGVGSVGNPTKFYAIMVK